MRDVIIAAALIVAVALVLFVWVGAIRQVILDAVRNSKTRRRLRDLDERVRELEKIERARPGSPLMYRELVEAHTRPELWEKE